MIIIFDLDYTLFDTKKFSLGFAQAIGISQNVFISTYKKYFLDKNKSYNYLKHFNYLKKEGKIDYGDKEFKNKINKFLKNASDYLFPEAVSLLDFLKKEKHELILLTYGDLEWQKMKIKNLLIKKYFNKIIITAKDKEKSLNFLKKKKEKIIIINDKIQESLKIRKMLGRGEIILIKSKYSNIVKHNYKEYNLREVQKILCK